jgi:hypothetical protein
MIPLSTPGIPPSFSAALATLREKGQDIFTEAFFRPLSCQ